MLWLRRGVIILLFASLSVFMFAGCEAAAGYLLYDLISGGPIFGDGDGDGDGNGNGGGNHPPVIITVYAFPESIAIGGKVTLAATATDEDDDTLTYIWQASKGDFSDDTAAVTVWTAPTDTTGLFQISITVSDGNGGVDIDIVEVEVTL